MIIEQAPIQLIITGVTALSTILGLFVAYQAYRGYRRNAERSMRYLSIGFILLMGISFTLAFSGTLLLRFGYLPSSIRLPLTLVVRLIQLAGVAFITYSLYIRR